MGFSQGFPDGVLKFQSTEPTGQAHNFRFSSTIAAAQSSNHDHASPGTQPQPSDSPWIDRFTRKAVPTNYKMSVVYTGPLQSDHQVRFLDPTTNVPLLVPPIGLDRDQRPSNSTVAGVSVPPDRTKASGVLCRSDGVPLKVTVSGWTQSSDLSHQLDNTEWTTKSLRMCTEIGHRLEALPQFDHDTPYRYEASHVEKQFLAYVYSKLSAAAQQHPRQAVAHDEHSMDWEQTFEDIFVEREIVIFVDRPRVCKSCMECAKVFREKTGIKITLSIDGKLWMC